MVHQRLGDITLDRLERDKALLSFLDAAHNTMGKLPDDAHVYEGPPHCFLIVFLRPGDSAFRIFMQP